MTVGDISYPHQPGCLVAVASGTSIVEKVQAEGPWHVLYLFLNGEWADQLDGWLRPEGVELRMLDSRMSRIFAEAVELVLERPPAWQWTFTARYADILGCLYGAVALSASTSALASRIAHIADDAGIGQPSVAEIAAQLGLTPRQLSYAFKKEVAESLPNWLRRRRIIAAQRLLASGLSVSEVSDRLNFANPYHFSRVFKRVIGIAPSAVRGSGLFGHANYISASAKF